MSSSPQKLLSITQIVQEIDKGATFDIMKDVEKISGSNDLQDYLKKEMKSSDVKELRRCLKLFKFEYILKKREGQIFFNKAQHRYLINSKYHTPVTQYIHEKRNVSPEFFYMQKNKLTKSDFDLIKGNKEVKDEFEAQEKKFREAGKKGTDIHLQIKKALKIYEKGKKSDDPLIQLIYDFIDKKDYDNIFFERRLYTEVEMAGTFDFLGFKGDTIDLVDWKTCDKIWSFSQLKLSPPFDKLDDCNLNVYSLQLCMYKYMLEKEYELQNVNMSFVVVKPEGLTEYPVTQEFYENNKAFKY